MYEILKISCVIYLRIITRRLNSDNMYEEKLFRIIFSSYAIEKDKKELIKTGENDGKFSFRERLSIFLKFVFVERED